MKNQQRYLVPTDIVVPETRQRKEFTEAALKELKESIKSEGLINPITVEMVRSDLGDFYRLVAGERRLRACTELLNEGGQVHYNSSVIPGTIPVIVYFDLTVEQRFAIELKENLIRADLTWQEKSRALAEYSKFQQEHTTLTQTEIAQEVKVAAETLREAAILAKHLNDPDVAAAKDKKAALKVIQQKAEVEHRAKLAKQYDLSSTPHVFHQGDAHTYIQGYEANTFDCIITDPPWGVDADKFGDQAGVKHNYKDNWAAARLHYTLVAEQGYRVAKPGSYLYCFLDIRRFEELELLFTLAGWKVWPRPMIWDKLGSGMLPEPKYGPRYTSEYILFARKGERELLKQGKADVVSVPAVKNLQHGAQKPAGLYIELLSRVCRPGDKVLDPFAGSGVIYLAANKLKLIAHGCEMNAENADICRLNMDKVGEETAAGEIEL